jgi:hypothetical protein
MRGSNALAGSFDMGEQKGSLPRSERKAKTKTVIASPEQSAKAQDYANILRQKANESGWVDFETGEPLS